MTKQEKYPCPAKGCGKLFKTEHGLKVHFKRVHNRPNKPVQGFRKSRRDD